MIVMLLLAPRFCLSFLVIVMVVGATPILPEEDGPRLEVGEGHPIGAL